MSKFLEKITVADELKNEIIKDMPHDLKNVEKAIYIYIKMCKILTYDDEYYVMDEKELDEEFSIHKSLSNVSKITPQNNKIVCYEFCAIYSKMLEEIGAKVYVEDQSYGEQHMDVRFEINNLYLEADSTISILNGDLVKAKLNENITGLTYDSDEPQAKKAGDRILSEKVAKVYDIIKNQEKRENVEKFNATKSFEGILSEYKKEMPEIEVKLIDKLNVFLDKIQQSSLRDIDVLGYMLKLKKQIFNQDEEEKNINIVVIREDNDNEDKKRKGVSAIITINPSDVNKHSEKNIYFLYTSRKRNVCYNNG